MNGYRQIGHTKKTFGIQGALKLECPPPYDAIIGRLRAVFFDVQGGPVPYFIAEVRLKGTPFIRFEDIRSPEEARLLAGKPILAAEANLQAFEEQLPEPEPDLPDELLGLHIQDEALGPIGTVEEVLDLPEQLLVAVTFRGQERLIPLHQDLILAFDPDANRLLMRLPEGLLDL